MPAITSSIWTGSFDGHRVDVRVPKNLNPTTPVLVMNDGMNVFFSKYASTGQTWEIGEAIDSGLITAEPLVIAVWGEGGELKFNPRRINEFLCEDHFEVNPALWETLDSRLMPKTREPRGNYYLDLVANQIMPAVAERYGLSLAPERTAMAGCSVAGVWSIYAATKRPDVFGSVLSFSSHWQFGGLALVDALAVEWVSGDNRILWSSSGTEELDEGSWQLNEAFGLALENRGLARGVAFETPTFLGAGHSETYWARQLPNPVNWWLSTIKQ